jgi:hypothetical protein
MIPTIHQRFMSLVKFPNLDLISDCWEWLGERNKGGYGRFYLGRDSQGHIRIGAHVYSYEYYIEPMPEGKQADHQCNNPWCVNPFHIEPATAQENIARSHSYNGNKTYCENGHKFTPENTRWTTTSGGVSSQRRRCRTCDQAAQRRRNLT